MILVLSVVLCLLSQLVATADVRPSGEAAHQEGTIVCIEVVPPGSTQKPTKVCGPLVSHEGVQTIHLPSEKQMPAGQQQFKSSPGLQLSGERKQSDPPCASGGMMMRPGMPMPPPMSMSFGMPMDMSMPMMRMAAGDGSMMRMPAGDGAMMRMAAGDGMDSMGWRQRDQPPPGTSCPSGYPESEAVPRIDLTRIYPISSPYGIYPPNIHMFGGKGFSPLGFRHAPHSSEESDHGAADKNGAMQVSSIQKLIAECDEKESIIKSKDKQLAELKQKLGESKAENGKRQSMTMNPQQPTPNQPNKL